MHNSPNERKVDAASLLLSDEARERFAGLRDLARCEGFGGIITPDETTQSLGDHRDCLRAFMGGAQ